MELRCNLNLTDQKLVSYLPNGDSLSLIKSKKIEIEAVEL